MSQLQNSQDQGKATKETNQLLEDGSPELQEYITKLKTESTQSNAKSLCCFCWCRLTNYQKQRHTSSHEKGIRFPLKHSDMESFKQLAKLFAHIQKKMLKNFI